MKEWTIRAALMMWRYGWEAVEMEALVWVGVVGKALAGKPPQPKKLIVTGSKARSQGDAEQPDREAIRAHAARMAGRKGHQGKREVR